MKYILYQKGSRADCSLCSDNESLKVTSWIEEMLQFKQNQAMYRSRNKWIISEFLEYLFKASQWIVKRFPIYEIIYEDFQIIIWEIFNYDETLNIRSSNHLPVGNSNESISIIFEAMNADNDWRYDRLCSIS